MDKPAYILTGVSIIIFLAIVGLFAAGVFTPKNAAISIDTNPKATVYINRIRVGVTPYEAARKPQEVVVRLVPEKGATPLTSFETKVTLVSGVRTVIRREFGDTDETSAGEIISFEKAPGDIASLSVVSDPDLAQVSIDGSSQGFSPTKRTVSAGQHQLSISAQGYEGTTLTVQTFAGYNLTAFIKLATSAVASQPQPTPTPAPQTLVEILPTPTGFLRVRQEPNTQAPEVGQVTPGQKYPLIEEDQKTGWLKIEYQPGKEGWITNQYAATPSASPAATP